MSVLSVREMWSPRVSAIQGGKFTAARGWTVELSAGSAPEQVLTATDPSDSARRVARIGESYPGNVFLRCTSARPRRITPTYYEIVCGYEMPDVAEDDPTGQQGPLAKPPEIRWEFVTGTEPIQEDIDGEPIVNTAGEPFETDPEVEYADPRLIITRYEKDFSAARAIAYGGRRGVLNRDLFFGAKPGQALMRPIVGEQQREGGLDYWRTTYTIDFREGRPAYPERAWWLRILNQGMTELLGKWGDKGFDPEREAHKIALRDGLTSEQEQALAIRLAGTPVRRRIKDVDGEPATSPVLLDRSGRALKKGQRPVWLEFNVRPSVYFSVLRLP